MLRRAGGLRAGIDRVDLEAARLPLPRGTRIASDLVGRRYDNSPAVASADIARLLHRARGTRSGAVPQKGAVTTASEARSSSLKTCGTPSSSTSASRTRPTAIQYRTHPGLGTGECPATRGVTKASSAAGSASRSRPHHGMSSPEPDLAFDAQESVAATTTRRRSPDLTEKRIVRPKRRGG
jgi:hypothetical protein